MNTTCEIHIPISPTSSFFTRVHYLAASIKLFGGRLLDSKIVVTVGEDCVSENLYDAFPWSRKYHIEWRWLDRPLYSRHIYYATALQRFCYEFTENTVLMLDADTLLMAPIDDLVCWATDNQAICGLIAHVNPFPNGEMWEYLFEFAKLGVPPLVCEYSGWGLMDDGPDRRYAPPYFNLGVLLAPQQVMSTIGKVIYEEMEIVNKVQQTFFRCQLALAMAIQRTKVSWYSMPIKYNFPNDIRFCERYESDLQDIRILHYLRADKIDKDADFESPYSVEQVIERTGLNRINEMLREKLSQLHDTVLSER